MNLERLKREQLELAKKVVINTKFKSLKLIAGSEVLGTPSGKFVCCIAVVDYESLKLVESSIYVDRLAMKYIPGFMGFSQGPNIVQAFLKLKHKPELIMVKGHGIAHPRRLGIASQLGLQLGLPTVGIATKLLCGRVQNKKLIVDGEVRGAELPTREFAKPIYVSPGHLVSLNKTVEVVQHCLVPPHKMPEPIFIAHKLANRYKKTHC